MKTWRVLRTPIPLPLLEQPGFTIQRLWVPFRLYWGKRSLSFSSSSLAHSSKFLSTNPDHHYWGVSPDHWDPHCHGFCRRNQQTGVNSRLFLQCSHHHTTHYDHNSMDGDRITKTNRVTDQDKFDHICFRLRLSGHRCPGRWGRLWLNSEVPVGGKQQRS